MLSINLNVKAHAFIPRKIKQDNEQSINITWKGEMKTKMK